MQNVFMYIDSILCNGLILLVQGNILSAFSVESLSEIFKPNVLLIAVNNCCIGIVTSFFLKCKSMSCSECKEFQTFFFFFRYEFNLEDICQRIGTPVYCHPLLDSLLNTNLYQHGDVDRHRLSFSLFVLSKSCR